MLALILFLHNKRPRFDHFCYAPHHAKPDSPTEGKQSNLKTKLELKDKFHFENSCGTSFQDWNGDSLSFANTKSTDECYKLDNENQSKFIEPHNEALQIAQNSFTNALADIVEFDSHSEQSVETVSEQVANPPSYGAAGSIMTTNTESCKNNTLMGSQLTAVNITGTLNCLKIKSEHITTQQVQKKLEALLANSSMNKVEAHQNTNMRKPSKIGKTNDKMRPMSLWEHLEYGNHSFNLE